MSRPQRFASFTCLALVIAAPVVVPAQGVARIDLLGATQVMGTSPDANVARQSAIGAAAIVRPTGFVFGDLRADGLARDPRVSAWSVDAGMMSRAPGAWRLGWTASASGAGATDMPGMFGAPGMIGARPVWNARATASARFGGTGVWVGAGPGTGGGSGAAGAWALLGNALVSATVETDRVGTVRREIRQVPVHGFDSVYTDTAGWHVYPATWTRVDTSLARFLGAAPAFTLRADWAAGRWAVSAWATRRAQSDTVGTAAFAATVTTKVANGVGLVAGAGASSRGAAGPPARYVSFGVRLWSPTFVRPAPAPVRPVARAFMLEPAGAGRYRITLRAPFARTVEVTGDFNGWTSTALAEASPGVWELTLDLAPGVHMLNVRVNGEAWTVPPGVHTAADEFNGRVGLIVVP